MNGVADTRTASGGSGAAGSRRAHAPAVKLWPHPRLVSRTRCLGALRSPARHPVKAEACGGRRGPGPALDPRTARALGVPTSMPSKTAWSFGLPRSSTAVPQYLLGVVPGRPLPLRIPESWMLASALGSGGAECTQSAPTSTRANRSAEGWPVWVDNPHTRRPSPSKPVLFKGQLYLVPYCTFFDVFRKTVSCVVSSWLNTLPQRCCWAMSSIRMDLLRPKP